jgi:hypothetical protein
MNFQKILLFGILLLTMVFLSARAGIVHTNSVYNIRPDDSEAFYFTAENYNITGDGKMDVSAALQKAINGVKTKNNFGILFLPEGKYRISRTIYIAKAIRLVGYGKNRAEVIRGKNTPGYQQEVKSDKGGRTTCFGLPTAWWKKEMSREMLAPARFIVPYRTSISPLKTEIRTP